MAGNLFQASVESGYQLDVVGSGDFKVVGIGTDAWGRPGGAELSEWRAVLDAVEDATRKLTVLELGAGIGRWTVIAAAALRRYRPDLKYRFIAVEAEPTHYRWMKQHTRDNGLRRWSRAGTCKLIQAAVSGSAGRENFYFGSPMDWYGQALVRPMNEGADAPITQVRTVTLSSLLRPLDRVDLIDLDVQGVEVEVLAEASAVLGRVRRVHVETHSEEIDAQLPEVFERAAGDWQQEMAIPIGAQRDTPLGDAVYLGGVQLWRNDAS